VKNGQVVTIQEHMAFSRTDGKRQTPNIIDDIESLKEIYSILRTKNIWHATCSEIAQYFEIRSKSKVQIEGDTIIYNFNGRRFNKQDCSLVFSDVTRNFKLISDIGKSFIPEIRSDNRTLIIKDFPAETKKYKIIYE